MGHALLSVERMLRPFQEKKGWLVCAAGLLHTWPVPKHRERCSARRCGRSSPPPAQGSYS